MACIRMSLRSRVLDVDTVVNVVIPYDHFDREGRPKPFTRTLYLLHGLRQNADAWQRMSSAERFANYYGYALIMPDAQRSFYTDMAHGPRFFTYLTEELPEIMQAMFKIPADPAHTYVGGLSMGGYGALKWRPAAARSLCGSNVLFLRVLHPESSQSVDRKRLL